MQCPGAVLSPAGREFSYRPVLAIIYCPIFLMFNVLLFQQAIAKAIEEKISGDQRRYLLNEQLKAIKKVLHYFCCSYRLPMLLTLR
jgi:hypothetical protein